MTDMPARCRLPGLPDVTGFRRLGFGVVVSSAAIAVIHGTFAYPSQDSWIPHPLLPINTKNMHRTKHGSDSEVRPPHLQ